MDFIRIMLFDLRYIRHHTDDLVFLHLFLISYVVFNEYFGSAGYGYMSPYYSENGKLCTYDTEKKIIIEIE
jgi:hypothetical protein